jgi:hypothetical protein
VVLSQWFIAGVANQLPMVLNGAIFHPLMMNELQLGVFASDDEHSAVTI